MSTEDTRLAAQSGNTAIAETFAPMEGYSADDMSGKEGITAADWKPAFLALAQLTSKAKDETGDAYIPGIQLGDIYNTETKQVFGKGPVEVQLLRHRKRAYLPDENGRMGEEIAWDDPRCEWPTEEEKKNWKGKGKPHPEGVRVYDWVVLILNGAYPELAIVSFKSKSFGAGQTLAKWAGSIQGPAFIAKFKITSQLQQNDAGKFGVFAVETAGKPSVEQAAYAKKIYEQIKDKAIPTDEQGAADDAPDGDAAEAPESQGGNKKKDKVPF